MLEPIPDQSADFVCAILARASAALRDDSGRHGCVVHLPAHGCLTLTGDLHDNLPHLEAILRLAGLDKSADQHVILHELIHGDRLLNGMDFSYRMLVRVADLVVRYPGQVHPLLGNHELAQMRGTAVGKGAGDSVGAFRGALDYVFGDDARRVESGIVDFLSTWPIALRTESGLHCSHSLPAESAMATFDRGLFEREIVPADWRAPIEARAEGGGGSAYAMLWGRRHSAAHLDRLAEEWGVKVFVVGHEHAESGYMAIGTRGLVLNSDHACAVAVRADLGQEPDRDALLRGVVPLSTLLSP